jgi:uncharacterized membrane protein
MRMEKRLAMSSPGAKDKLGRDSGRAAIAALAVLLFLLWTATSWARWANFAYRTFDLAYYVQALWQLIHGRLAVSVEDVPLLGNHVEPIVFLFAPLFLLLRHPMLFVVVQNAGLAAMGPVAYSIGRRLGLDSTRALLLAVALMLTPATGYIALHEFHPEALAAPFLLLMLRAWICGKRGQHWLWFLATLACKENMALLLVGYCAVQSVAARKRDWRDLRAWFGWPLLVAGGWFVLCATVITPAFNSGSIDYGSLYNRLGQSSREIVLNAFLRPQLFAHALITALREGNLVWGLLFPFLLLPLLKPKWLLATTPILLQHLLSWRSSEWMIYFHYAAPLLPFFWIATAEAIARPGGLRLMQGAVRFAPALVLAACLLSQALLGPANEMAATAAEWIDGKHERERRQQFIANVPTSASVVAPLPYLSHLAMRKELYSLHYILKGLKTLSRARFQPPPPTEFVLIDYADTATFDPDAGYYHPAMRTVNGDIVPSSDQLLHDFLKRASWDSQVTDELTILRRTQGTPARSSEALPIVAEFTPDTRLIGISKSADKIGGEVPLRIQMRWSFDEPRTVFPWLDLRCARPGAPPIVLTRGLCAPEANAGFYEELWEISSNSALPAGDYSLEAVFTDKAKALRGGAAADLAQPIPLGSLRVLPAVGAAR